jgi:hypothetical protein
MPLSKREWYVCVSVRAMSEMLLPVRTEFARVILAGELRLFEPKRKLTE